MIMLRWALHACACFPKIASDEFVKKGAAVEQTDVMPGRAGANPESGRHAEADIGAQVADIQALHVSHHISDFQKLSLTPDPNHLLNHRIPSRERGRWPSSLTLGRGAVDADALLTNGA
jgi:hypothetical protein